MYIMPDNKGCRILLDFDHTLVRHLWLEALVVGVASLIRLDLVLFLGKLERIKFVLPGMARKEIGRLLGSLSSLAPMENAIGHLIELKRDNTVTVFTKRTKFLLGLAEKFLEDNGLGNMDIIGAEDKVKELMKIRKNTKGAKIIIVDDNRKFIAKVVAMKLSDIHVILFSHPRAMGQKKTLPVDVVYSWDELFALIRDISS